MNTLTFVFVLFAVFSSVSAVNYVRFVHVLNDKSIFVTDPDTQRFPSTGNLSFAQASPYVVTTDSTLNVQVYDVNNSSFPMFPASSQTVVLSSVYTTVLIIYDETKNGALTLISYGEELGVAPSDSSIQNQMWLRVIDARNDAVANKISIYTSSAMNQALYAHVGYLFVTLYRVRDNTTTTSVYVRDDKTGESVTVPIDGQAGFAYTVLVYSTPSSSLSGSVVQDRPVEVYKSVPTQTIPDDAQDSFGSKTQASLVVALCSLIVALVL